MPKLNILHLIVVFLACATIFTLLREARGRSLPPGQLFTSVPFALATAILLLAMANPETRQPRLWLAGLAAGIAIGVARASYLTLQLDRMYSRLRLPKARDGLLAACLLALCVIVALGAALALSDPTLEVGATCAVAASTGYLSGRAITLWRRSLSAPHHTLHHTSP
ncbi:MAG: hypothetical protein EPO41_26975 [Reyranella sp.]|uniref:hypothetical protein n=1 Tax=Reyranella sp. TaxID=1929291 RepID=UPI001222481B|nr:hypothetical protein [Reyranella sp.]TAJ85652.1 MAG: hypothetical protein EPO41_26975 [Reyranella sp.]